MNDVLDLDAPLTDLGLTRAQDVEVRETLAQWEAQKRRLAQAQMKLAASVGYERRFVVDNEGNGGEVKMSIHPTSYHYWGQRLGYQCWDDKQFCREYLRDNPAARVKSRPDNPTVVVASDLTSNCKKRFSKVYQTNKTTTTNAG